MARRSTILSDSPGEIAGYVTPLEAAARLGHPRRTVTLWCSKGWVPGARKVGVYWFIPVASLAPGRIVVPKRGKQPTIKRRRKRTPGRG